MKKYLLIINQKNENMYMAEETFYRLYKDYEKAREGFEKWKEDLIKDTLEHLEEEEKQDYLEEVEDNELFDLFGDYEMSCACPNSEWNLYVVAINEEE